MGRLAVVRTDPLVPVRDLLLFDDVYVLNLEAWLERIAGLDLANALFLIDEGVLHPAPSTLGALAPGQVLLVPTKGVGQHEIALDLGGETLTVTIEQFSLRSWTLRFGLSDLPIPDSAARIVAAGISETLAPGGHCTFMVDPRRSVWDELLRTAMIEFAVRFDPGHAALPLAVPVGGNSYGNGIYVRVRRAPNLTAAATAEKEELVYSVVLRSLPTPAPDTPVEDVLQFKREVLEHQRLERLGRWVQRLLLEDAVDPRRLYLDIEDMIEAYRAEFKAQRMNITTETVCFLLTLPGQVVRALVDPSALSESVMKVTRRRARLLQSEMAAEGHELAYVASAQERFHSARPLP